MSKKLICLAVMCLLAAASGQNIILADDDSPHQQEQPRPIKLGTSGGNINDSSSAFCCGGTLGSLVEGGGVQYILSNNHVLARTNIGLPGEQIIQPGLIDQNSACYKDTTDTVANLSEFVTIRFKNKGVTPLNEVDAAIAQVVSEAVEPNGAILDIGTVSYEIVEPSISQPVKKSGRTTGLTIGTVDAINVTVDVSYTKYCGGGGTQTARFVNQISIAGVSFCGAGDSGSLIVENVASNPRAAGLLFAGNSNGSVTIANPISAVLNAFDVAMPGGTSPPPGPTGSIKGTVTNSANRAPIQGATVRVDSGQSATTDISGAYIITGVAVGAHSVTASAAVFKSQTKTATVNDGAETTVDFALKPVKGRANHRPQEAIEHAVKVKNRHEQNMLQIDGVVGIGVGLSGTEAPAIKIYLKEDRPETRSRIPAALDDVPVQVVVTGAIEAI